jgi:hypothetical protein
MDDGTEEADQMAQQSLQLARENDEHGHEAWALRLLGEIRRRSSPSGSDESARYYSEALALASQLGMRPLVAHARAGLGTLATPLTPPRERRAHHETAIAMLREMGMEFWLAKVGREDAPA